MRNTFGRDIMISKLRVDAEDAVSTVGLIVDSSVQLKHGSKQLYIPHEWVNVINSNCI